MKIIENFANSILNQNRTISAKHALLSLMRLILFLQKVLLVCLNKTKVIVFFKYGDLLMVFFLNFV